MNWMIGLVVLVIGVVSARQNAKYQVDVYGVPNGATYYAKIVIGSNVYNPQNPMASSENTFNMLLDTGSSNEAVAATGCCSPSTPMFHCAGSQTCEASSTMVEVKYVRGQWSGNLVRDTFSGPQLGIHQNIEFAAIGSQQHFLDMSYQGIMGLAYKSLAQPKSDTPKTFLESIVEAGAISDIFGLQLCGTLQPLIKSPIGFTLKAGTLVLGGINGKQGETFSKEPVKLSPLIQEKWYVVLISSMGFGSKALDLPCSDFNTPQAIVDSGTTNLAFPSNVYLRLTASIRAAVKKVLPNFPDRYFNDEVPCCEDFCDPTRPDSLLLTIPSITISLALEEGENSQRQMTITIPPEYFWRPTRTSQGFCRVYGISEGSSTVLGDVFMDGLYVVHDRERRSVGFGIADNCPNGASSSKQISESNSTVDWCECMSSGLRNDNLLSSYWPFGQTCNFWFWWMYVVAVCAVIVLLCSVYIAWSCAHHRRKKAQYHQNHHHHHHHHHRRSHGHGRHSRSHRHRHTMSTTAVNPNIPSTPANERHTFGPHGSVLSPSNPYQRVPSSRSIEPPLGSV